MIKTGDQVKVYGTVRNMTAGTNDGVYGFRLEVISIISEHLVHGISDQKQSYSFHPKQCRKLTLKKRREFWLNIYGHDAQVHPSKEKAESAKAINRIECVRVREVLEKKAATP